MSTRDLVFDIFAIDRASAVFSRVGAEADGMGAKVSKGSKMAGDALLVAGSVAVGLGIKSVMMAAQFDSSITRLGTTAGESKAHLGMVSQGILDMAGKVGWSAQSLATAMYQVESGGYHGAAALLVLKDAAQAARIEGSNVTDVAHALTGALNDYRGTTLTAAEATNAMTAAVGSGMMTFNDLAEAMPKIGARAAATHVTFEEMLAALGTMTKDGLPAANAATYLGQTIGQLAAPTAKARTEMKGLGINATAVAQTITSGSGHGLSDAIEMLYKGIQNHLVGGGLISVDTFKKMASSTTAYQQVLAKLPPALQTPIQALATMAGGVRSFQGILMLGGQHAQQYADTLDAVTAQVKKGGDQIAGFSDVQKTLAFQAEAAKASLSALGVEIGQKLTPLASDALGVFSGFIGFLSSHQQVVIDFGIGAVAVGSALLAWKAAAIGVAAAEAIATGVTTAFGISDAILNVQLAATAFATEGAASGFAFLGAAMEATPIGMIALGLAGVAVGVVALIHAFDSSGPAIKVNQAEIDGLKLSYDHLTGSIQATGAAQIKQNLQSTNVSGTVYGPGRGGGQRAIHQDYGNAIQAAHDLGIQESALQLALMGNRHEMDFVTSSLEKMAHGNSTTAAEARGLLSALHLNQQAIVQSGEAQMQATNQAALLGNSLAKIPGYYDMVNHATSLNASMLAGLAEKYGWSSKQIATVLNTVMVPGGKAAVDAMIAQLDRMPVKLQGEAANALASGQQIGNNLGAGVTQGIGWNLGGVISSAVNLVDQALKAAKNHIKSKSPSQKTRDEIGIPFAQGIAVGMDSMHGYVAASSRRLVTAAHKAAMTEMHVDQVELNAQLTADNSQLSKVNQQIAAAEAWGKAFEGNVFSASLTLPNTSTKMMVNGTPVTITGTGQGITASSSPTQVFAAMMAYQTAQAKQAKVLSGDIAHLRKEGISAAVLAQMQASGVSGVQEISALAHATKQQVAAFDRLVAATQGSLDNTGALATSGHTMATLQAEKNRDAREVANIKRALHGLKLTIANGGATLRPT